jgi:hypothetical protein
MRKIIRIGKSNFARGRARDDAVKGGIIKLTGNQEGATHLVEMGHEVADGRDKGIGIHDLHGINTADISIHEVSPRERELSKARLPARGAIRVGGKNPAFIKQGILTGPIKASHASHAVRHIGCGGVGDVAARTGRRALILGIEHQHLRGGHVTAVVPNVGDDDASQGTGKIDPHATRGIISRIKPYRDGIDGRLARRRVGRFAGRHGHDLLAHDHEAVVEDAHHHDQKDGQDDGEFDKGLASALPASGSQPLKVGERLHGSFPYMFVC